MSEFYPYKQEELEQAQLRLIDAIPTEPEKCHPDGSSLIRCETAYIANLQEVAEDVALWPTTAANLLGGYLGVPSFDGRLDGAERWTTDEENAVGTCLIRRALGECPIFEVKDE